MDLRLQHPFTCIVSGMTGSGKSYFVRQLLTHLKDMVKPFPQRLIWLYGQDQELYQKLRREIPSIEFNHGIPPDLNTEDFFDTSIPNLLVIDDLMTDCKNDERLTKLFTIGSHHKNLSIVFIVQNLFLKGREMRNISLNTHYFCIFKNPRDNLQFSVLARQMFPTKSKFVVEAYEDATSRPYGYLFLDLKPNTLECYRVRTNIVPREKLTPYFYVPL